MRKKIYDQVLPQLPKKWLSHYLGAAVHQSLPGPVQQAVIKSFATFYNINLDEIEKPLSEYESLGEFFSRALKEGARPIGGSLVHPCDGKLIQWGSIHDGTLIQAKGKSYRLEDFIPDNPWPEEFEKGTFFTYYLAPYNYHRVHSPMSCKVTWAQVVPGELWPVNGWSVKRIDQLYATNERVALGLETVKGKAILTMVGATNVGSMSFPFDTQIKTNQRPQQEKYLRTYPEGHALKVGDELGTFHMGSTVVLLLDKSYSLPSQQRKTVEMGQSI